VDSLKTYKPKLTIVYNENTPIHNKVSYSESFLYETISVKNRSATICVPGNGNYRYAIYAVSGKKIVGSDTAVKGRGQSVYLGKAGIFIVIISDNNRTVRNKIAVYK
jgi:hypothetical protein